MKDYRNEALAAHPEHIGATRDYKAWAKRIVYREVRGDTLLVPIQAVFARDALELLPMKPEDRQDCPSNKPTTREMPANKIVA